RSRKTIYFDFDNGTLNLEVKYIFFKRLFNQNWKISTVFQSLQNPLKRLTVFCNRKMQNNAIKNAEVCHPISSFLTVRGTVYNSHHGMKLYVRDELICPLTLLLI